MFWRLLDPAISNAQGAYLRHMMPSMPVVKARELVQRYFAPAWMHERSAPARIPKGAPGLHPAVVQSHQQPQRRF